MLPGKSAVAFGSVTSAAVPAVLWMLSAKILAVLTPEKATIVPAPPPGPGATLQVQLAGSAAVTTWYQVPALLLVVNSVVQPDGAPGGERKLFATFAINTSPTAEPAGFASVIWYGGGPTTLL